MRDRLLLFDQYGFMGGGQTIFLSLLEAALRVDGSADAVFPPAGPLEAVVRRDFGDTVTCFPIRQVEAASGRKSFVDKFRIGMHSLSMLRYWRMARRSRLIVANGTRQFPGIMLLSVLSGRPVVYYLHIDLSLGGKALVTMIGRLPTTRSVLCNSGFILGRMERGCPAVRGKLRLAECALSPDYSALPFEDRFGNRTDRWAVAVIGTVRPEKGQEALVTAAAALPNMQFHIIGGTPPDSARWVEDLRRQAGANVTFHGPTDDIASLVARNGIGVVVVPSRWEEPFGLVAIEGMALSCVTLVRLKGGLVDIAAETGALPFTDDDELAPALAKLAALPVSELTNIAREQYRLTQKRYDHDRLIRDLAEQLKRPSM